MKMEEARAFSPDELDEKEDALRKELFNLKFRKATAQLDNTARIKILRRDVARLLTLKNERRAGAADAPEEG